MVFDFYLGHSGRHQQLYSPKCDFAVSTRARRAIQGLWLRSALPSLQQPRGPGQRQHINNASQCKIDSIFLLHGSYSSFSWRENMTPACPQTTFPALSDTTVAPPWAWSAPAMWDESVLPPSHSASAPAMPLPLPESPPFVPTALDFQTFAMESQCWIRILTSLFIFRMFWKKRAGFSVPFYVFLDLQNGNYIGPTYFTRL